MRTPKLETLTARVTATALLSEVLLQPGVITAAVPTFVPPEAACDFTGPVEFDPMTAATLNLSEPQELELHEPEAEWSKQMEKRFEQLSISEASGTSPRQSRMRSRT